MNDHGGEMTGTLSLKSREDACSAACKLAEQAKQRLLLHSDNLDAALFDQQPFLDAVTRLALNHRDAMVLILIHDARRAVQENNRMIELARRLSSHIQLRRPAVQHRHCHETFLLADNNGYLQCALPGRYEGTASFNDPGKTSDLKRYFMEVWDHAEVDPELRRLHL